jgi:DNA-binding transcriptional ArsR family regulator
MALSHPLPQEVVDLVAHRFRVLAEPTRIRILERLLDGELSVQELVDGSGMTQQNVSKHLAVLLTAGVVGRRRQGVRVYYRIADESVFDLCALVCRSIERRLTALGQELREAAS